MNWHRLFQAGFALGCVVVGSVYLVNGAFAMLVLGTLLWIDLCLEGLRL